MNLAYFRANHDFSQWSLSDEGMPVERSDNTGMAMLFEAVSARAGRLSSAATEERKIIGGPEGAKSCLSEKSRQILLLE